MAMAGWAESIEAAKVTMPAADHKLLPDGSTISASGLRMAWFKGMFESARAWRNGRRARLRIWSRKGWRFKSSRAHHLARPTTRPPDDGAVSDGAPRTE